MRKILEFIVALILASFMFPFGFFFNLFNIWRFKDFLEYYIDLTLEVVEVVLEFFRQMAIFLDILGNVIAGRLFYYILVNKSLHFKDTHFGQSGWTISASTGHVESYKWTQEINRELIDMVGKLNNKGIKFSSLLSRFLVEKNHCLNAYYFKLHKENYKKV